MNYIEKVCGKADPSIEEAIGALLKVRAAKDKQARILSHYEAAEDQLEKYLLQQLEANGLDRVSAHGVTVRPVYRLVPQAVDWEQVHAWVRETGDLSILQRRLAASRVAELAQNDGPPPGIKLVELGSLSVRANRRRFPADDETSVE
jgi:hypothetical protein